ncbi:hypothetical protein ACHAQH_009822 [Verticillium albo-atrum]
MSQSPNAPKPPSAPRLSADALATPDDAASRPPSETLDPATGPQPLKHITRDIKQAKNTVVFHATMYDHQELLTERLDVDEGSWNAGGAFDPETTQLLIRTMGEDKKVATPASPAQSTDAESRGFRGTGHPLGQSG